MDDMGPGYSTKSRVQADTAHREAVSLGSYLFQKLVEVITVITVLDVDKLMKHGVDQRLNGQERGWAAWRRVVVLGDY